MLKFTPIHADNIWNKQSKINIYGFRQYQFTFTLNTDISFKMLETKYVHTNTHTNILTRSNTHKRKRTRIRARAHNTHIFVELYSRIFFFYICPLLSGRDDQFLEALRFETRAALVSPRCIDAGFDKNFLDAYR